MYPFKFYLVHIFLIVFSTNIYSQSSSHYEKALQSYVSQDFNDAYIHLKNALKDNPSDLAAKMLMGEILLINGYFNEAITEFEEALDFGADANLVLKPYGKSLILTKEFDKILLLDYAGLNDNNKFELNVLKATAYASLGDNVNAEKNYLLALAIQPDNTRALNGLTTLYLKRQNISLSQKYLTLSMQSNSLNAGTWRLKGLLEKQQKETAAALTSFERAYQLNPNDPFVLRAYADGLWDAKRTDEAEKILEIILSQTPDDPYAILLQSQILSVSNKTKEAQQILGKLAHDLSLLSGESVASNISLRFASGMTAYLTKNYEQALPDIMYYVDNSNIEINTIGVLADTYMKINKERSALKLLEENEKIVSENLNMSLLLCDLYLNANRAFKCAKLSELLKEKYPDKPRVDFIRAKTFVARNKIPEAINILNQISDPKFYHQKELAKAHLYFQTEQYLEAHKIAAELLEELPEDIDILNLNVALLIKKQDWDTAEILINRILVKQPNYGPARFNKANLLGAKKQYQDALNIMLELEKEGALQAGSYLLYAEILTALKDYDSAIDKLLFAKKLDEKSIPISKKLIELYILTERFREGLREIENYSRRALADDKYVLKKAELMHKLGQIEESQILLNRLFVKWQKEPSKLIELSRTQLKTKDFDGVEKTLLSILDMQENKYLPALLQLNELYSDTNRPQLAQKYLSLANRHFQKNPEVMVAQAKLYIQLKEYQKAYILLWDTLAIEASYLPAFSQLYQLSNIGKGTRKFITLLENLLSNNSDNHLIRNLLADTYLLNHEFDNASSHYNKLLALHEYANKSAVLNNLAIVTMEDNLEGALQLVEQGLQISSKSPDLIDTKGWILANQGKYNEALVLLRQAFSMNSNDPAIRYHLAYTLHKLGRKEEAKKELESAFALNLPFIESAKAKALKDQL
jgi:putative PEP-CTERM system TPR-repeat lipoprotein